MSTNQLRNAWIPSWYYIATGEMLGDEVTNEMSGKIVSRQFENDQNSITLPLPIYQMLSMQRYCQRFPIIYAKIVMCLEGKNRSKRKALPRQVYIFLMS